MFNQSKKVLHPKLYFNLNLIDWVCFYLLWIRFFCFTLIIRYLLIVIYSINILCLKFLIRLLIRFTDPRLYVENNDDILHNFNFGFCMAYIWWVCHYYHLSLFVYLLVSYVCYYYHLSLFVYLLISYVSSLKLFILQM